MNWLNIGNALDPSIVRHNAAVRELVYRGLETARFFGTDAPMWPLAAGAGVYGAAYLARRWNRSRRARRQRRRIQYRRSNRGFSNKVARVIHKNAEKKFHDIDISGWAPYGGASTVTYLTDIDQGDTDATREGNMIHLKSIQLIGQVQAHATPVVDSIVRVILFTSREHETANPVPADILESDAIHSLYQHENKGHYKILKDFRVPIRVVDTGGVQIKLLKMFWKPKKPLRVYYDGTGGGITDNRKNGVWMMVMTNQGTGTQPTWNGSLRVKYTDF